MPKGGLLSVRFIVVRIGDPHTNPQRGNVRFISANALVKSMKSSVFSLQLLDPSVFIWQAVTREGKHVKILLMWRGR